eukprot:m.154871 g.154871  ORF g.154871 m.154871 type:complete len:173 (-) comp52900_c0_seq1:133-651(-)
MGFSWSNIGFQNDDTPELDLGPSGILGLRHLLYFADHYPARFQLMVENSFESPSYPIAHVAFHLTVMLMNMLEVANVSGGVLEDALEEASNRSLLLNFICALNHDNSLDEIFCIVFDSLFDREFAASGGGVDPLMLIPSVHSQLVQLLRQHPVSLDELQVLIDFHPATLESA